MANNLTIIADTIRAPETMGKLMLALGHENGKDPAAINDAKRYASSVLAEVERTAGDSKKDLTTCTPNSIVQAMIDAAKFRLMIDGRQHAHLVKYGAAAVFQPGYRAYLFKVKEAYPDADITVRPIYNGETVRIIDEGGDQTYSIQSEIDPFDVKDADFKGVLVSVVYTDNGRLIRKAQAVTKARIDRAKSAAKQDYIWKSDYVEKAKAAAIKAAFKIMFASIQGLQEMIRYDNEKHYDIEKPIEDTRPGSIVDNLNKSLAPETAVQAPQSDDVIDGDFTTVEASDAPAASNAAESGDMFPGDMPSPSASRETVPAMDEAETKRTVAAIKRSIAAEETVPGMSELWDKDFKDDIAKVQASSKAAYDHLVAARDARIAEIEKGGAA